jgi:hypothetical protein
MITDFESWWASQKFEETPWIDEQCLAGSIKSIAESVWAAAFDAGFNECIKAYALDLE